MIVDDEGSRLFVCSDSDFCGERRAAGHVGTQQAVRMTDALAETPQRSKPQAAGQGA
jgi:alpha-D-ribose 1-methylphosphonate 5-phosphate C-P lyase